MDFIFPPEWISFFPIKRRQARNHGSPSAEALERAGFAVALSLSWHYSCLRAILSRAHHALNPVHGSMREGEGSAPLLLGVSTQTGISAVEPGILRLATLFQEGCPVLA
jgi:hypothetical protein